MSIASLDTMLLIALVLIALPLIAIILIQQGKGADMGAAFGSGAANTLFGGAGASSFLVKLTTYLAIAFFIVTFALAYVSGEKAGRLDTEGIPKAIATEAAAAEAMTSEQQATADKEGAPSTDVPTISLEGAPSTDVPAIILEGAPSTDAPAIIPSEDQ